MLLLYRLGRLKSNIALILMISAVHLSFVQSHVCMFVKRPDPSRGGILRWSLPKEEICICQAVVAPNNIGSSCPTRDEYEAGDLWFVDDPRPLTRRSNWRVDILDDLLQRTDFCANECTLKTDNCDINAVCKDIPGSYTCTCNAGYAGDGAICLDIEKPEWESCPSNITEHTDPGLPTAAVIWTTPTARDNSEIVHVSCNYGAGSNKFHFKIGDALVECRAVDESGNVNMCFFTVSVLDEEDPLMGACSADLQMPTDLGNDTVVVTYQAPTATDNSGEVVVACVPPSASEFAIGSNNVVCTVRDGSENSVNCEFTVDVKDEEDPLIGACPADLQMPTDTGKDAAVVSYQAPTTTDNSGEVVVVCVPPSESEFAVGSSTVVCTAQDESENSVTCEFTVDVQGPCNQRLGIEDGRISDNQLTASSVSDGVRRSAASYARLNRPAHSDSNTGAWCAAVNEDQWIQAALGDQQWVTGVLLQGRQDYYYEWVTKYKVQYSDDEVIWTYVLQEGTQDAQEFNGNADQNTVVTSQFPMPVKASFIRIQPTDWNDRICLRFELLGCEVHCSDEADWITFGDHDYCFAHAPDVSYAQAEAECERVGANLTSIHSQEEQDFIAANTMDVSLNSDRWWGYWIGLNDRDKEDTFVWTDGTEINYVNWYPEQPNNWKGSEDCVVLSPRIKYLWNDINCTLKARAYICKKQS